MVAGFGDVGKGLGRLLRNGLPRARVGDRPDLRASGCHGGLRGRDHGGCGNRAPTSSSPPRATKDIITIEHMRAMKDPRHRLQHRPLRQRDPGRRPEEPQVVEHQAAGGRDHLRGRPPHHPPVGGAPGEPRQRHGHPSFVMSASFHQPDAGPDRAVVQPGKYQKQVYTLPKTLDEKVAALHLEKIGVKLSNLRPDQAAYIGVAENGPFKSEPTATEPGVPGGAHGPDRGPSGAPSGPGTRPVRQESGGPARCAGLLVCQALDADSNCVFCVSLTSDYAESSKHASFPSGLNPPPPHCSVWANLRSAGGLRRFGRITAGTVRFPRRAVTRAGRTAIGARGGAKHGCRSCDARSDRRGRTCPDDGERGARRAAGGPPRHIPRGDPQRSHTWPPWRSWGGLVASR